MTPRLDPRESYRTKVALGLLVVIVVGGLVGAFTYRAASQTVQGRTLDTLEGQADVQSQSLATSLDGMRAAVETLSGSVVDIQRSASSPAQRRRDLNSFLTQQPMVSDRIDRLHLATLANGTIELSSDDAVEGETLSAAGIPVALDAVRNGTTAVTFRGGERPAVVVAAPVVGTSHDQVLVAEVPVERLQGRLEEVIPDTRTRVLDSRGRIVLDTGDPNATGTQHVAGAGVDSPAVAAALAGENGTTTLNATAAGADRRVVVGYDGVAGTRWALVTYAPPGDLYAVAGSVGRNVLLLLGAVGVLLLGFVVVVERPAVNAIDRLADRAETVEGGDLDVSIESDRDDEIGRVFRAVDGMRGTLGERLREAEDAVAEAEQAQERARAAREEAERLNDHLEAKAEAYSAALGRVADGDLTARVDPESDIAAIESMGETLNGVLTELGETIRQVRGFSADVVETSDALSDSAGDIEDASDAVRRSVETITTSATDQRERLREVGGEMDDLSATIEEVASTASEVAATADETAERGEAGQAAATEAVDALDEVERATEDAVDEVEALVEEMDAVVEVVDLIADVAEQTNMLALNANIEAARADGAGDGGSGAGFSVVADEVKALAEETQGHADDVEARVESIREQSEVTADGMREARTRLTDAVETVETALEALDDVADHAAETNRGMHDISEATDEQATSVEQVAATLEDVTTYAEDTAADAEDAATAADRQVETVADVTDTVADLADRATTLNAVLDEFEVAADAPAGGSDPDTSGASSDGSASDVSDTPGDRSNPDAGDAPRSDASGPAATDGGGD
ncbi:MAG: methyl-accepting chemotaxis protein [Haloarculaceae archaeon]